MNNIKVGFEKFLINCCKSEEFSFRKFIKKTLKEKGFTITEDDYEGYRDGKFKKIHNLLAIRGNPRVCLVAHTDVCRDHMNNSDTKVIPVIKTMIEPDGKEKRIVQDKNCEVQVGGDDRTGCAINLKIALDTGYDLALLFTTDEEVGLVSAEYVKFPELLKFDLLVQVDRGNHSGQLVNQISGREICKKNVAQRLLKIANNCDDDRYLVNGFLTDVFAIHQNDMCKDAVNMTCGYHNSIGAETDEYIDVEEAYNTMRFVANIVRYYYLEEDKNDEFNSTIDNDNRSEGEEDEEEYYFDDNDDENVVFLKRKRRKTHNNENELFSESNYYKDKMYFDWLDRDDIEEYEC